MIQVCGSPIGGESVHERAWRRLVAEAAAGHPPLSAVGLHFRLRESRRVDLDNLVRPALAGLRDSGVFNRGYRNLDLLVATKRPHADEGLDVDVDAGSVLQHSRTARSESILVAAAEFPREGDRAGMVAWRERVAASCSGPPVTGAAWVDVAARTAGSLEALMKPVIDGLEPFLGRDPRGRSNFAPNDHLVVRLVMRRQLDLRQRLAVAAGSLEEQA
jgi:hypothetical protein